MNPFLALSHTGLYVQKGLWILGFITVQLHKNTKMQRPRVRTRDSVVRSATTEPPHLQKMVVGKREQPWIRLEKPCFPQGSLLSEIYFFLPKSSLVLSPLKLALPGVGSAGPEVPRAGGGWPAGGGSAVTSRGAS